MNAESHYNSGVTLQNLGRLEEAKASYQKAIELKPNYIKAYNNLGLVFKALGENQKAISCYEKLLNFDPTYKIAYSNYGNVLLKVFQYNKGLAYIRKGDGVIRFTQKDFQII